MIRRALFPVVLVAGMLLAPAASRATPLDIPAAAPKQFRALLRAKLHTSERHASATTRVELQPQHGYRMTLIGEGNVVALVVMRQSGNPRPRPGSKAGFRRVLTGYVTRGTVTPSRIEGSFGHLGSVALRFRPSGRVAKDDPRGCVGRSHYTTRFGVFTGHIRFTGEHGYIAMRAHRAKGRVRTPRHLRCRHRFRVPFLQHRTRSTRRPARRTLAELAAEDRHPTNSAELLVFQLHDPFRVRNLALLLALQEETDGQMAIIRYALAFVRDSVLSHNDALTSATLRPPRPFHGKGLYRAAPDGTKTWSGSLSVAFPGAPRQPLTGPDFTTQLEVDF